MNIGLSRKVLVIFTVLTTVVASSTQPAVALTKSQADYYSSNDTNLYDPDAEKATVICGPSSAGLVGDDNLEKVYNYFIGQGLAPHLAAAVVGNVAVESGGNPINAQVGADTEDPSIFGTEVGVGKAWGLIQWDAGGRAIEYAEQAGITTPIYELATQLELVWWHMNNVTPAGVKGFLGKFKSISDVKEATLYFRSDLERAWDGHDVDRIVAAENALNEYGDGVANVTVGYVDGCTGAVDGNLIQTVLNYTAHEYHAPNYFDMTPAYKAAVQAAQANGEYVGGGPYPGIDCGGFVTRVMRDSGYDPNYNSSEGNTDAQLVYLENSPEWSELLDLKGDTTKLQPGDVAIRSGHTYLYVGTISGFETTIASASISYTYTNWRAPMAGKEKPADPNYRWFRKVNLVNV